jgi:hypothetical protein
MSPPRRTTNSVRNLAAGLTRRGRLQYISVAQAVHEQSLQRPALWSAATPLRSPSARAAPMYRRSPMPRSS